MAEAVHEEHTESAYESSVRLCFSANLTAFAACVYKQDLSLTRILEQGSISAYVKRPNSYEFLGSEREEVAFFKNAAEPEHLAK